MMASSKECRRVNRRRDPKCSLVSYFLNNLYRLVLRGFCFQIESAFKVVLLKVKLSACCKNAYFCLRFALRNLFDLVFIWIKNSQYFNHTYC